MKRLVIVGFLVLALAVGWRSYGSPETGTGTLTLPQPAPNVGERAPDFTARTADGDTFELKDKGIYVLTFWSTLNEGSSEARPAFTRLAREYSNSNSNVSFAAVYVSNVPDRTEEAPYTLLQDSSGRLASLYNVKRVPRLFLIENGRVALVHNGYYDDNEKLLKEALGGILKEKREGSG